MNQVMEILIGICCVFLIGILISSWNTMNRLKKLKVKIVEEYGQPIDISEVDFKMNSVASYFENKIINKIDDGANIVDDITWNDLSMDDIFKKINNTQSTAGRELLYDMLRRSLNDEDKLRKRENIIIYFEEHPKERFNVQYILGKLGYSRELYTSNCLFNEDYDGKNKLMKYRILSILPLISLILIFFEPFFVLIMIGTALLNVCISLYDKKKNYNTEGFTYLIKVINTAKKIKKLNIKEIDDNIFDITEDLKKLRRIRKKSVGSDPNSLISELNILSEYTSMLFLSELITYEKVKKNIIKNKNHLINVFEYVGIIDALIGVASFRESLNYFEKPNLDKSKNQHIHVEFRELYHPLIDNPIANSGFFDKSALITGSNASGKSTFIKSVAINAILAQSIFTVCAKEYSSSYFKVYTSMALKDDVLSKESYYIVEIKSLKRILDSIDEDIPCLCFVDEILRGTNTIERIASSSEVLNSLSESNCICFAATHDIELTYILEDKFYNYHFEENITDNDIKFDYKLYEGRAQSRNAIKLLGFMGYSDEIVNRAQDKAEKFVCTGKW